MPPGGRLLLGKAVKVYTDGPEQRALARGGVLFLCFYIEYTKGKTQTKLGWSVWDKDNNKVSGANGEWQYGELLELLQDFSLEACMAWDNAHTAWTCPRLFES